MKQCVGNDTPLPSHIGDAPSQNGLSPSQNNKAPSQNNKAPSQQPDFVSSRTKKLAEDPNAHIYKLGCEHIVRTNVTSNKQGKVRCRVCKQQWIRKSSFQKMAPGTPLTPLPPRKANKPTKTAKPTKPTKTTQPVTTMTDFFSKKV